MSGTQFFRAARRTLNHCPVKTCPPQRCCSSLLSQRIVHRPVQYLPHRRFGVTSLLRRDEPTTGDGAPLSSDIQPPKQYVFEDINSLSKHPDPNRIIIDVREPSELLDTGRIPTAKSVPISSGPDAFFMPADDFESKFGFPRPGQDDEVIFYCKAGVRSRQAALLAAQAQPSFGGKIGNYNGSWLDWQKNGGRAEKEGEQ